MICPCMLFASSRGHRRLWPSQVSFRRSWGHIRAHPILVWPLQLPQIAGVLMLFSEAAEATQECGVLSHSLWDPFKRATLPCSLWCVWKAHKNGSHSAAPFRCSRGHAGAEQTPLHNFQRISREHRKLSKTRACWYVHVCHKYAISNLLHLQITWLTFNTVLFKEII